MLVVFPVKGLQSLTVPLVESAVGQTANEICGIKIKTKINKINNFL